MSDQTTVKDPPSFFAQALASAGRHAMAAGAGALVMWGVKLTTDQTATLESVGSALGLAAASYLWSLYQKREATKRLAAKS
jgi:diphthamide synthase (EF-2-diphthine--ammonia ligase)